MNRKMLSYAAAMFLTAVVFTFAGCIAETRHDAIADVFLTASLLLSFGAFGLFFSSMLEKAK